MPTTNLSRRNFLRSAGTIACVSPLSRILNQADTPADYTLTIAATPIELAPNRIISTTTYNGQFPGPLLRLKQGQRVTVDIHNETDIPEQLHWHGQFLPTDTDGAAEEGTPFIPPHGSRRISFIPGPSGFRFYHTHVRAGADLAAGQYSGLVGPVYIEPAHNPGDYDREVFLTLKEFQPTLSRGGDMAMDFLSPSQTVPALKQSGETKMNASLAKGTPHGYEVGYDAFTINGRMLGHGEPIRVKPTSASSSTSSTAAPERSAASPSLATPSPSSPWTATPSPAPSTHQASG